MKGLIKYYRELEKRGIYMSISATTNRVDEKLHFYVRLKTLLWKI